MDSHNKKPAWLSWSHLVVALLAIVLVIVFVLFVFDIKNLYQTGSLKPAVFRMHRRPLPLPAPNPLQIQGWMTFRYINYIFGMPANYLTEKLKIGGSGSLNITLDKYAALKKLNKTTFLESVRQAVAAYKSGVSK